MAVGLLGSMFADFFKTTGPLQATGKKKLVNEMQRRTFFSSFIMGGAHDMEDHFRGGEKLQDQIVLDRDSTWEHYAPDDELTYRSSENLSTWEAHWRFATAHLKFTDHEVKKNGGGSKMSTEALFQTFKDLMRPKEMNLWTSICEGIEDDWFAAPDNASMEVSTGKAPYSLPCFVNEYQNGTTPGNGDKAAIVTTTGLPPGFSTIQQISPATKPKWDNVRTFYSATGMATQDIWEAMGKAYRRTHFRSMPKRADLGEGETYPGMIITSEQGDLVWEKALQNANDPLAAASKAKGDPHIEGAHYRGIPIYYLDGMTHGAFYADGFGGTSTLVGEHIGSTDIDGNTLAAPSIHTGPRYGFIDNRYIRMFYDRDAMFQTAKITPERQPWARVLVVDVHRQNYCRSRQRNAWVGPAALFPKL